MRTLLFLGFMCLFMSCHKYPDAVEQALEQAGDNRKELEKVLEHFRKQGKIPYQSACFFNREYAISSIKRDDFA